MNRKRKFFDKQEKQTEEKNEQNQQSELIRKEERFYDGKEKGEFKISVFENKISERKKTCDILVSKTSERKARLHFQIVTDRGELSCFLIQGTQPQSLELDELLVSDGLDFCKDTLCQTKGYYHHSQYGNAQQENVENVIAGIRVELFHNLSFFYKKFLELVWGEETYFGSSGHGMQGDMEVYAGALVKRWMFSSEAGNESELENRRRTFVKDLMILNNFSFAGENLPSFRCLAYNTIYEVIRSFIKEKIGNLEEINKYNLMFLKSFIESSPEHFNFVDPEYPAYTKFYRRNILKCCDEIKQYYNKKFEKSKIFTNYRYKELSEKCFDYLKEKLSVEKKEQTVDVEKENFSLLIMKNVFGIRCNNIKFLNNSREEEVKSIVKMLNWELFFKCPAITAENVNSDRHLSILNILGNIKDAVILSRVYGSSLKIFENFSKNPMHFGKGKIFGGAEVEEKEKVVKSKLFCLNNKFRGLKQLLKVTKGLERTRNFFEDLFHISKDLYVLSREISKINTKLILAFEKTQNYFHGCLEGNLNIYTEEEIVQNFTQANVEFNFFTEIDEENKEIILQKMREQKLRHTEMVSSRLFDQSKLLEKKMNSLELEKMRLNEQIKKMQQLLLEQKDIIETLRNEQKEKDIEISESSTRMKEMEKEHHVIMERLKQEFETKISDMKKSNNELRVKLDNSISINDGLQIQLKEKQSEHDEILESKSEEITKLEALNKEKDAKIQEKNMVIEQRNEQVSSLEKNNIEQKGKISLLEKEMIEKDEKVSTLESEVDDLQNTIQSKVKTLGEQDDLIDSLQERLEEKKTEIKTKDEIIQQQKEKIRINDELIQEKVLELEKTTEELERVNELSDGQIIEIDDLKKKIEELERKIEQQEEENAKIVQKQKDRIAVLTNSENNLKEKENRLKEEVLELKRELNEKDEMIKDKEDQIKQEQMTTAEAIHGKRTAEREKDMVSIEKDRLLANVREKNMEIKNLKREVNELSGKVEEKRILEERVEILEELLKQQQEGLQKKTTPRVDSDADDDFDIFGDDFGLDVRLDGDDDNYEDEKKEDDVRLDEDDDNYEDEKKEDDVRLDNDNEDGDADDWLLKFQQKLEENKEKDDVQFKGKEHEKNDDFVDGMTFKYDNDREKERETFENLMLRMENNDDEDKNKKKGEKKELDGEQYKFF